jgi:hypothetical protein
MKTAAILSRSKATGPPLLDVVPEEIRNDVRKYVAKADGLSIDPSRIVICACLLVVAERRPECYLPRGRTVSMAPTSTLGPWYFDINWDWKSDPAEFDNEVKRRYARARKAMQENTRVDKESAQRCQGIDGAHGQTRRGNANSVSPFP